jgi:hypothetical protein
VLPASICNWFQITFANLSAPDCFFASCNCCVHQSVADGRDKLSDLAQFSFLGIDIMIGFKSLLQMELDDNSSCNDDDYFIIAAAGIVQTFSGHKRKPGGSVPGHVVIYRDRQDGHQRMFQDYLAANPTYGPHLFRRRLVFINL